MPKREAHHGARRDRHVLDCASALGLELLRQPVEIFDERHYRAVEAPDFRIGGFDNIIFVRRVRAAAVAKSEVPRGELERFACEHVTGLRTGVARPEQCVDSELFVVRQLGLDQCRIF